MNFDLARHNMVVEQLERRGIHDPRVLEAMDWVPRHEFVPPDLLDLAYDDRALPIGLEQTISQPYTVAFMCQEARLAAGRQSAGNRHRLGLLRGGAVAAGARSAHGRTHRDAVSRQPASGWPGSATATCTVYSDDGTLGLPAEAPFDAIVVAAGAEDLPKAYPEQLAEGGRLLIPIGPPSHQQMVRIMRRGGKLQHEVLGSFGFVPLVSDVEE